MTAVRVPQPPRPWMGLAPYGEEDQGLFFGRDLDADAVRTLIERDTLSVLFAASGIGKTSILKAGVFPRLRSERCLPVYVKLIHDEGAPTLSNQIVHAVQAAAGQVDAQSNDAVSTLWQYFHRRDARLWAPDHWPLTPVLVLDQFEEIFTLGRRSDALRLRVQRFLEDLSDLVENRPPAVVLAQLRGHDAEIVARGLSDIYDFDNTRVRIVFSLREDYLAQLEVLRALFPTIRNNRLRLTAMTSTQALEVVEGPGQRFEGFRVLAPGAAAAIVSVIARRENQEPGVQDEPYEEERPIEPALLSLFCDQLYGPTGTTITPERVAQQGRGILMGFYEGVFDAVPPVERNRLRTFIEDELVTHAGHRDSRDVSDIEQKGVASRKNLDVLVDRRLLRYEPRASGGLRVELVHDVLAGAAKRSRDERQGNLEREKAVREKEAAQELARKARRQLLLVVACVAIAAVGLGTGVWGAHKSRAHRNEAYSRFAKRLDTFVRTAHDLLSFYKNQVPAFLEKNEKSPRGLNSKDDPWFGYLVSSINAYNPAFIDINDRRASDYDRVTSNSDETIRELMGAAQKLSIDVVHHNGIRRLHVVNPDLTSAPKGVSFEKLRLEINRIWTDTDRALTELERTADLLRKAMLKN